MPISPNQSSESGGQTVTITGVNLANAIAVHFGENPATITANTPTSITVVNPAGKGVVAVSVTTNGGTSNGLFFFYIPFPIVSSLDPESGPTAGGNTVNIYGYNLSSANTVNFGGNSATPTIVNDGQLSVVVPAGVASGSVLVNVTTAGGVSANLNYTYYDAPTISSLTPTSGPTVGGTSVTITGTDLASTQSVTFGGVACSFGVINSATIAVITPAGSAGTVDVVVTSAGGSATAVDAFTYVSGPGI